MAMNNPQPHPRFITKLSNIDSIGQSQQHTMPSTLSMSPQSLHGAGRLRSKHNITKKILYPVDFGADPSGSKDSADAFDQVITAAWSAPSGSFTNGPDNSVIIDLQGGTYSISHPIYFPKSGGGGIAMRDGIIRASETFPEDPVGATGDEQLALFMLTTTNGTTDHDSECCWFEYIYFTNLVLDASLRTGCVRIHTATRIVFDEIFFTGFATTGLYYGEPSHQLLLSRSFFGTTDWRGGPYNKSMCEKWSHARENIGLHIDGPDNQVEDTVFFCSGIGIKLSGSANYFEGIHAFTGAAERYPLGALYVPAHNDGKGQHGNRFEHCYWDYSGVRIENPVQIEFLDNYVIGNPSREDPSVYFVFVAIGDSIIIDGLRITGSIFRDAGAGKEHNLVAFMLNETNGYFHRSKVKNTLVADNIFTGVKGSSTRFHQQITQSKPSTEWIFDLCKDVLLGPSDQTKGDALFAHLQYSLRISVDNGSSMFVNSAITKVENCTVTISTESAVSGTIYLEVDQSQDTF